MVYSIIQWLKFADAWRPIQYMHNNEQKNGNISNNDFGEYASQKENAKIITINTLRAFGINMVLAIFLFLFFDFCNIDRRLPCSPHITNDEDEKKISRSENRAAFFYRFYVSMSNNYLSNCSYN